MFAEFCVNAISPWPLLFYLIIQNSVNLNLIAVCHGETHWACAEDQLFTMHTAAGLLLFEVRNEMMAGDWLTWNWLTWIRLTCVLIVCQSQKSWRHTCVWIQGERQKQHFQFPLVNHFRFLAVKKLLKLEIGFLKALLSSLMLDY